MVGNKLSAVKGAVGGDGGDDGDDKEKAEEEERERQEAIREAEERRKEKHRKMEEEREKMRQEIRDKYNIKKKEEIVETQQEEPNPLMRKKKTPEELAAEAEQEDLDDFTKLKNQIETQTCRTENAATGRIASRINSNRLWEPLPKHQDNFYFNLLISPTPDLAADLLNFENCFKNEQKATYDLENSKSI
ncbi:unnamed protein product [Hermetia illucens]|uniref:Complexin n=1 Tax=Hermetia illucens TaxID=343691 RepID=A0A7R8UP38_HERIL|nr:unnamed protein product [Hermetia illucens]